MRLIMFGFTLIGFLVVVLGVAAALGHGDLKVELGTYIAEVHTEAASRASGRSLQITAQLKQK